MDVKIVIILLLWLAATQAGDCFEFPRAKTFRERDDEAYTVYIAQFSNTNEVKWIICGKCPDTQKAGEFVCSELIDFTQIGTERYLVNVTRFTNTKKDGWNVRITLEDSEETNMDEEFACGKLNLTKTDRADDYFVFVKHIAKSIEIGWFVCQRKKQQDSPHYVGKDYCRARN